MKNMNFSFLLKFLLVFILATTFSSYKEKASKEKKLLYTIPFSEIKKNQRVIELSEFASNVEIIQLENIQEALLGRVKDIQVTKNFIFVFSGKNPVLQFSRDGKFIRTVGKIGQGPKEYDRCLTFSIDEKNHKIYIQSFQTHKIMVYDLDGNYIETIKYPAVDRLWNVWSRDSFLVSFSEPIRGNEPFVFIEHNKQGDTLQTVSNHIGWNIVEYDSFMAMFFEQNTFYRFNNKLHLKGWYNDTIYTYDDNNKFIPKYIIDLKGHKLPDDLIYVRKWKRPFPKGLCWTGVHETYNYIFIPYGYHIDKKNEKSSKEELGCILFNKKMQKGVAIKETKAGGFINDISGGPDFRPRVTNDSTAIMAVSALDMKQYLNSEQFKKQEVKNPEEKEKLVQLNKTLKEDDNHFLMVVKLKN